MTQPIPELSCGQTQDHIGRSVFIVDDECFLFQHYPRGDLYVYTSTWTTNRSRIFFFQEMTSSVWDNTMKTMNGPLICQSLNLPNMQI